MDYITETEIRYSQVNSGNHVTLTALAQIIEDATTKFLSQHHLSGKELNDSFGAILVVLRNHIFFHSRCHMGDILYSQVKLIRKANVAIHLKTELFRKGEEEPVVTSYIELVAIDMIKRTLRSMACFPFFQKLPLDEEEKCSHFLHEEDKRNETTFVKPTLVESTDIDYSNHLNNIAYIRYFLNCLKSEEIRHLHYKELQINYIKEAKEGSMVNIYCTKKEKEISFLMEHENSVLTKAKLTLA